MKCKMRKLGIEPGYVLEGRFVREKVENRTAAYWCKLEERSLGRSGTPSRVDGKP